MEDGEVCDTGRAEEVLRSRARVLARVPDTSDTTEAALEVVEFLLASERYAVETVYIREVYPLKDITPVPCTPSFVLGILSVRGQILSVIDLRKFFDLPQQGLSDLNRVIIVRMGKMETGILADEIVGVRGIPPGRLQSSLPTLTGVRADYLRGVTDERLAVLDVSRILSDPNLTVYEEVE
jgi:purine-binding chemotaxis protein CheW